MAQNNREIYEIERVLALLPAKCRLHVVRRFEEVSCYFGGTGIYSNRSAFPIPVLVLLDLNLPDSNRIMNWVRNGSACRDIPFVGMGDFKQDYRIQGALDTGINAYCDKTAGFNELAELIVQVAAQPASAQRSNTMRSAAKGSSNYIVA